MRTCSAPGCSGLPAQTDMCREYAGEMQLSHLFEAAALRQTCKSVRPWSLPGLKQAIKELSSKAAGKCSTNLFVIVAPKKGVLHQPLGAFMYALRRKAMHVSLEARPTLDCCRLHCSKRKRRFVSLVCHLVHFHPTCVFHAPSLCNA